MPSPTMQGNVPETMCQEWHVPSRGWNLPQPEPHRSFHWLVVTFPPGTRRVELTLKDHSHAYFLSLLRFRQSPDGMAEEDLSHNLVGHFHSHHQFEVTADDTAIVAGLECQPFERNPMDGKVRQLLNVGQVVWHGASPTPDGSRAATTQQTHSEPIRFAIDARTPPCNDIDPRHAIEIVLARQRCQAQPRKLRRAQLVRPNRRENLADLCLLADPLDLPVRIHFSPEPFAIRPGMLHAGAAEHLLRETATALVQPGRRDHDGLPDTVQGPCYAIPVTVVAGPDPEGPISYIAGSQVFCSNPIMTMTLEWTLEKTYDAVLHWHPAARHPMVGCRLLWEALKHGDRVRAVEWEWRSSKSPGSRTQSPQWFLDADEGQLSVSFFVKHPALDPREEIPISNSVEPLRWKIRGPRNGTPP